MQITIEIPVKLRNWIANPPAWLSIQATSFESDERLNRLNPGEQAALYD